MFNDSIRAVQALPFTQPKKIKDLLAAYDSIEYLQPETVDLAGVLNAKTAPETVLAYAKARSISAQDLAQAKNEACKVIWRELAPLVAEAVPTYHDQLQPMFDQAANAYSEAIKKLPREFNSEDALKFTGEQFEAFQTAKEASATIKTVKHALKEIGNIVTAEAFPKRLNDVFMVLDPMNVSVYIGVQKASKTYSDTAYRQVNPVLLQALKDGAELRLLPAREAAEELDSYEDQRLALPHLELQRLSQNAPEY